MKKILFVLCLFCAIQLTAQTEKEKEKFLSKIADSDQAIADPKKGTEAKTWISRAEIFTNIYDTPRKSLLPGMAALQVRFAITNEKAKTDIREVNSTDYEVMMFDGRDLYFNEQGQLAFWDIKDKVVDYPLVKAYEAYVKASELDAKNSHTKKIKAGLTDISGKMNTEASFAYNLQKYDVALTYFETSLACSSHPTIGIIDSLVIYNTAFVARLAGNNDKALEYFEKSINIGFYQDGFAYANYATILRSKGNITEAKDILSKAFVKFPKNQGILTGLIDLYLNDDEGGNISEVLPYIKQAQDNEPYNAVLYYAEGVVYQNLNNEEKMMECFNKAVELDPNNYGYQYSIGASFYNRAVDIQNKMNEIDFSSQEEYDKMLNEMLAEFKKAIPYFTKAYELMPTDRDIVGSLRSIYYRFQEESPEMMEKFEFFKNLSDSME